jgi:hypothetical protein
MVHLAVLQWNGYNWWMMQDLSHLNDILLSPLGLAPLFCAALVVLLLRGRAWTFLTSLHCSNRVYILVLILGAATLSVVFCFLQPKVIPWGGSDGYFPRALNIVEYGVFGKEMEKSAFFPPGYTFLMVPLAYVLDGSRWVYFLTNLILLLVSAVLLRWMLIRIGASEGLANTFSLLLFLYPNRLLSTLVPFSDVPFSLLFTLAFATMLLAQKRETTISFSVLAGFLAGAAALVRSNGLLLLFPLALGFAVSRELPPLHRLKRASLMLLVAGAVLLPWTVRNYTLYHRVIPISNNGGVNLALGNNPVRPILGNESGDTIFDHPSFGEPVGSSSWNQAQWDSFYTDLGLRYIRQNPGTFAGLSVRRIALAMAADSYAFGLLEAYTNARVLIFTILGEKARDPVVREPLGVLYSVLYHLLFIVNNFLYYFLVFLAVYGLVRPVTQARVVRTTFLLVVACTWFTIALTFGVSRFKEPIGALLPLVVCMNMIAIPIRIRYFRRG